MNEVSDLNRESVIQRVIRDNALAALMVVLALVSLLNGLIIGVCIAVMVDNGQKIEQLNRSYEVNAAWQARLLGVIQAAGIEPPSKQEN